MPLTILCKVSYPRIREPADHAVTSASLDDHAATVPFKVEGADNVLLETIKRGEGDFDTLTHVEQRQAPKSVVLRLHEHMGGRATAKLAV